MNNKTYAVDLHAIRVYVMTDGALETLDFRTKPQADRKILELIRSGYTFDHTLYARLHCACPIPETCKQAGECVANVP